MGYPGAQDERRGTGRLREARLGVGPTIPPACALCPFPAALE